jgi:ribonuclease HI
MYIGYCDGGSRNDHAACAWIITNEDDVILHFNYLYLGSRSNNESEYYGLIMLLTSAIAGGVKELNVIQDSELVSRQVTGQYQVKAEHLKPLYSMAQDLIKKFDKITFETVSRENKRIKECDAYCTLTIKSNYNLRPV